jgi:chromosome segregation ATPase
MTREEFKQRLDDSCYVDGPEHLQADVDTLYDRLEWCDAEIDALRLALSAAATMREAMSETIQRERTEVGRLTGLLAESVALVRELDASTEAAALLLERDALAAEVVERTNERNRLASKLVEAEESNAMACERPTANCDCAGCSYAREIGGAK